MDQDKDSQLENKFSEVSRDGSRKFVMSSFLPSRHCRNLQNLLKVTVLRIFTVCHLTITFSFPLVEKSCSRAQSEQVHPQLQLLTEDARARTFKQQLQHATCQTWNHLRRQTEDRDWNKTRTLTVQVSPLFTAGVWTVWTQSQSLVFGRFEFIPPPQFKDRIKTKED